jgi:sulfoxide reductase heme-binding subunit YedZ
VNRTRNTAARFGKAVLAFTAALTATVLIGWLAGVVLGGSAFASHATWYISRAAGVTAYLLLSASTLWGLVMSTRTTGNRLSRASVFALHEHLSWLALGFVALHAGILVRDTYAPFRPVDIMVPFLSTYRPFSVGLGIFTAYLAALLTSSFYLQRRIGYHAWRRLHYGSFAAYGFATLHGIQAGNSTGDLWMQAIYVLSGTLVLTFTLYRVRQRLPQARRSGVMAVATTSTAVSLTLPGGVGALVGRDTPRRHPSPQEDAAALQVWRRAAAQASDPPPCASRPLA